MSDPLSTAPLDVVVLDATARARAQLLAALRGGGHSAEAAKDGAHAVRLVRERQPAVVLLAAEIAAKDDWHVIGRIRSGSDLTMIVVLGPADQKAEVTALDSGADDYVALPFDEAALLARVGAHRRLVRRLAARPPDEVYDDGLVRLDIGLRQVKVAGREISLTPLEFRLMAALVRNRDRVVGRDELQELAWQSAPDASHEHVKLYVHYLRRKLAEATSRELILTVRGFGYRWVGNHGDKA